MSSAYLSILFVFYHQKFMQMYVLVKLTLALQLTVTFVGGNGTHFTNLIYIFETVQRIGSQHILSLCLSVNREELFVAHFGY